MQVVALQSRSEGSIAELHARHQAECAVLQQANESLRDELTETEAAWKAKEEEIHRQHQQHVRAAYEAGAHDLQTNAPDFAALQREALSLRQVLSCSSTHLARARTWGSWARSNIDWKRRMTRQSLSSAYANAVTY